MKYILLSVLLIFSIINSSCSKDEVTRLIGTKWKSTDNLIELNFTDKEECKVIFKNFHDGTKFYFYMYEPPDIQLLIPAMTGFPSYNGTVSGKQITLISQSHNPETITFKKIK
jgi:hypothetical protein